MLSYDALQRVVNEIREKLDHPNQPRRIRINSYLYQDLSILIDDMATTDNSVWGIDIIEDPNVETYEIDY